MPLEPELDITELETDVGDAGLSVCCGDVLIELECDVGDIIPMGCWPGLFVGTGALYVQTIRSRSEPYTKLKLYYQYRTIQNYELT